MLNRRNFLGSLGIGALAVVPMVTLDLEATAAVALEGEPGPNTPSGGAVPVVQDTAGYSVPRLNDLDQVAQHVMTRLSALLPYRTALAEQPLERRIVGSFGAGKAIGMTVSSFPPGPESWRPIRPVLLTHQVSVMFKVPSHRTGERMPVYQLMSDTLMNAPEVVADQIVLRHLEPAIEALRDQILEQQLDVFTADLNVPHMGSSCEGAVGLVSRDLGMAIRVVRALVKDDLMMRLDLMGGQYPKDQS